MDRLDLARLLDVPIRKLSLGQKMRCELVAALLHGPEVLFLDEPTIGLDVVVKEELHAFLRALNRGQGTTVLLTSHDLDDIEQLCRRVMVIDDGRVLHDGDLDSLRRRYGHPGRIVAHVGGLPEDKPPDVPDGAQLIEHRGTRLELAFDRAQTPAPAVVRQLLDRYDVLDLEVREAGIEEVVKRIYRRR